MYVLLILSVKLIRNDVVWPKPNMVNDLSKVESLDPIWLHLT